eukprot:PITA_26198
MVSSGKIEIEKFNCYSFELWKLKMEDLLVDKGQWILVDLGTKPIGVSVEEWKKLDRMAKSTIRLCVSDSVFLNNRNKNKSSSGRSKSRGRSKSPRKHVKVVCWKCEKERHYKRDCKSKALDKGKGSDDAPSAEVKATLDEGGDVYLASSSTHVDHEAWLIDSGASFNFTPHREWFCEYEKYDGGDVFLGDDRKARIVGRRKVKLKLQGGRVRTLPGVLHIPALAGNLIFVSKLDDAGVKTVFEKDTCKMVRGALVLMWEFGLEFCTSYKVERLLMGATVLWFLKVE